MLPSDSFRFEMPVTARRTKDNLDAVGAARSTLFGRDEANRLLTAGAIALLAGARFKPILPTLARRFIADIDVRAKMKRT